MSVTSDYEEGPTSLTDRKLPMQTNLNTSYCLSDGIIVGIWAVVAAAVYAVLWIAQTVLTDDYWLSDLTLNLLGYSTIFLPGYAIIR